MTNANDTIRVLIPLKVRKKNGRPKILPVFVKEVVRRFHAASLISGTLISVSGLSQTGPTGCQLRVLPVQRFGFCDRAFA